MTTTRISWYKNHSRRTIDYLGEHGGREAWYAECSCRWYGTFSSRRAAVLALRKHKGPW